MVSEDPKYAGGLGDDSDIAFTFVDLNDIDSPIIEGSDDDDRLKPMGNAHRYDFGVEFFTQDLEIYGNVLKKNAR